MPSIPMPSPGGSGKGTLRGRFTHDNAARQQSLERARVAAALSLPYVLTPEGRTSDDPLPESHTSVGAKGAASTVGKLMLALYPLDYPWAQLEVDASIRNDPAVDPAEINALQNLLFLNEFMLRNALEQGVGKYKRGRYRQVNGFRSQKRKSLANLIVTGDTLERLTPDYRLLVYARHQYVTRRDSSGDILYHGIWECIDPLKLGEETLEEAKLKPKDLRDKPVHERMQDFYTFVDWNPETEKWVVTHECNGEMLPSLDREEEVSDFFCTAFELASGDDYGHGPIELNLGDLRTLNEGKKALNDFMFAASKFHPVVDQNSNIRVEDFGKPTGTPIMGARVENGQVQDAAFWQTQKSQDFNVVGTMVQNLTAELAGALLVQSAAVRDSERTTAYEVEQVVRELEGVLGGMYAPIADEQQQPLAHRTLHQLRKDKYAIPVPEDWYSVVVQTGIAALSRAQQKSKLLGLAQVIQQVSQAAQADPALADKVDVSVLIDTYRRYESINIPGLIRSEEEVAQRQQARQQQQAQMLATQQAIQSAGAIAESSATQR